MCYKVKKKIFELQDNPNPSGNLPIHRFEWYKMPRSRRSMSVYDLNKDANQAINHSFKYALENSNRSQTKILWKKGAIENVEDAVDNEAYGFIEVDPDEPMSDVFQIIPANPLNGAHLELAGVMLQTQDKSLGVVDIREPGKSPSHVTGDAVEGMNGPDIDRHAKRNRRWLRFKQDIYRDVLHLILKYEDQERTIELGRDYGEPSYLTFDPDVFNFEEYEFEARWSVEMREPDDLPQNRAKRNAAKIELMEFVLNQPPQRAKMALNFLDLEHEAALKVMLDQEIEAMQNQPQQPTEIEIEQQKAKIDIEKERAIVEIKAKGDAAQSIADAMEKMAEKAFDTGDSQQAIYILQLIPQAVQEAIDGTNLQQNQAFQQAAGQPQAQVPGNVVNFPVAQPAV